jgi:hypothetical protein
MTLQVQQQQQLANAFLQAIPNAERSGDVEVNPLGSAQYMMRYSQTPQQQFVLAQHQSSSDSTVNKDSSKGHQQCLMQQQHLEVVKRKIFVASLSLTSPFFHFVYSWLHSMFPFVNDKTTANAGRKIVDTITTATDRLFTETE